MMRICMFSYASSLLSFNGDCEKFKLPNLSEKLFESTTFRYYSLHKSIQIQLHFDQNKSQCPPNGNGNSPVRERKEVVAPALNLKVSDELVAMLFGILSEEGVGRRGLAQRPITQDQIHVVLVQAKAGADAEQHEQALAYVDGDADKVAAATAHVVAGGEVDEVAGIQEAVGAA